MTEPVRCSWVTSDQIYKDYHDNEWGVPLRGQRELFEKISLEGFQAGLSWLTILKKREEFRRAFEDFDINKVANFGQDKVEKLLSNPGIIRNRLKVHATINNARLVIEKDINLTELLWSFQPSPGQLANPEPLTSSSQSDDLSKELKSLGFKFVGSTTMYALMQSTGIIKSHSKDCFLFS